MDKRIDVKVILGILAFSIILGVFYNSFSINGIDFIKKPAKIGILESVDIIGLDDTTKSLKTITLDQAIKLHSNQNTIFIDARDKWEFAESHIQGAINIPQYSFEPNITDLSSLAKDNVIIVYCSANDCSMSKRLTEQLLDLGYSKAYVYLGGITEWTDAQLPIESSELK
ncbi:MAG: rhodanese-like domain-containing protein [Ignavibacteriae bacterium]|nr:rhodanese-like domain-containing protein [Ignavibacteriota bacterium]